MEKIAWIIGHTYIYWSDVVRTLAAAAAVCCFLALYLRREKRALPVVVFLPLAVVLSLFLSRLGHWYFRPENYESLTAALDLRQAGGFVLMGAFAGCLLAAGLVRLLKLEKDLPELLDCVSLAGCGGIALGRLEAFFNHSDRGMILPAEFPWAVSAVNTVSGAEEWRLATFLLQAVAAGVIFLTLLVFYLTGQRRKGDTSLIFLLFYGAAQVILDSTRYDSLYLRSNGFVSAVQVLGAAAMALVVILFAVRLVRAGGWSKWYLLLWIMQAGCLGLAGYMEYYVQRHGNQAVFAYSIMAAALADILLLALMTRYLAAAEEKKHAQWLEQLREEAL